LLKGVALLAMGLFVVTAGSELVAQAGDGVYPQKEITIKGKKPARFSHEKHLGMGMDCAQCHHNDKHEPLTAEAIGGMADTSVMQCASCHKKGFQNSKLQKRKSVFHARCRECHKAGFNDKKGPTKCNSCHIKKKRKLEGC